jgi:hypothetical protein
MPQPSPAPHRGPAGDAVRRRARCSLLTFIIALPVSVLLFAELAAIWARVEPLEGATFMLAATLLGAALAVAPVVAVAGFLLAVWHGVESVYLPRSRRTPQLDRAIVAGGLLVWFAPALGMIAAAVRALIEGRVHFVRPPRDYLLATDPLAYWQGVGFWLILAAVFAFLAWRYWRGKLSAVGAARP